MNLFHSHLSIYYEAVLHEREHAANPYRTEPPLRLKSRWQRWQYHLGERLISIGCRLCRSGAAANLLNSQC